jgi:hypothetical protein
MRVTLTFLFIIGLSGCIAYPSKHVSLAEQRFTFKNASQLNAAMYIGVDQTEQCNKASKLHRAGNDFIFPAKYSWLRVRFVVPVTGSKVLFLCVTDNDKNHYQWQTRLYYFGSLEPESNSFECAISEGELTCSAVKT